MTERTARGTRGNAAMLQQALSPDEEARRERIREKARERARRQRERKRAMEAGEEVRPVRRGRPPRTTPQPPTAPEVTVRTVREEVAPMRTLPLQQQITQLRAENMRLRIMLRDLLDMELTEDNEAA